MMGASPLLAAWVHDLDPVALNLFGLPIRWYGLAYIAGFALGFLLLRRVARMGRSSLRPEHVGDLVMAIALGVILGGRLGYVLFYRPELLWTFSSGPPFWGVLAIHEGGMASHGGMLGGLVACVYVAWRRGHSVRHLLDLLAFGGPLGLALGRVANFINGELIGRPVNPEFPLAVQFPQEIYDWPYELQLAALRPAYGYFPAEQAGAIVSAAVGQVQRGSTAMIELMAEILPARHPSQLYAAGLEGLLVFTVLAIVWFRPRRPGLIAGLFGITYGAVRIVGEQFRMPDAHLLGPEGAMPAITRGQWLSAGLILAGTVLCLLAWRSKQPPMGGWGGKPATAAAETTPPAGI